MWLSSTAGPRVNTIGCRVWRAKLVLRQVAVIVTAGATPTALAAKAATETIPIFVLGSGPGPIWPRKKPRTARRDVTGVTVLDVELIAKGFELLHELVPAATTIGVLGARSGLLSLANFAATKVADLPSTDVWVLGGALQAALLKFYPRRHHRG
jgi:ABC-type uncharacterized transport system substrate-binding protein